MRTPEDTALIAGCEFDLDEELRNIAQVPAMTIFHPRAANTAHRALAVIELFRAERREWKAEELRLVARLVETEEQRDRWYGAAGERQAELNIAQHDLAEARAEVAALRSEVAEAAGIPGPNGEADWDCLLAAIRTRGDDVAAMYLPVVAEVAALREGVELVREWQAAKHANHQAYDAWREVAVKNPGVRMPEVEKVYSTANECRAIESRLLAATLPEVGRG